MIKLKDSAIFIADSHYSKKRTILEKLLLCIENNSISSSQLFLMGDIFDFLSFEIEYFNILNKDIISLINKLSYKIEIIYLEGNHDFNLTNIFSNVKVIPRGKQPIKIESNSKIISISHGDIFTPNSYEIFTKIIRNSYFLSFLNTIDYNYWLSKIIEKKLENKNICHKQSDFTNFIKNRIFKYNSDFVIEGHYHQGYIDDKYINIHSLCCANKYLVYSQNKFKFQTI